MIHYQRNQREVFWDDTNINRSLTSAPLVQHEPRREEIVLTFDQNWEGDGCNYFSIMKVGDVYRCYYFGWKMYSADLKTHSTRSIYFCLLTSSDGIHWERPDLGLYEYEGNTHNNILLKAEDPEDGPMDNFTVFYDENPACPEEERYKATVGCNPRIAGEVHPVLHCYVSPDGLHWKKGWQISDQNKYDSQNVAFWDEDAAEYKLFVRDFHGYQGNWVANGGIRDIRMQTSRDFRTWTDAQLIDFLGSEDIALYTSAVQKYKRAAGVYIGFPSRYMERQEWTPNFDQLAGADWRKVRMAISPRYGLAVTDCVFMVSRDGYHWNRFEDAWMRPGIEREWNWVYGDCYPSVGFVETESELPCAPAELSLYCSEKHWSNQPAQLRRYTVRKDGFVSRHASYSGAKVVTQKFTFEGSKLHLNFSTSARGHIKVTVTAADEANRNLEDSMESCELFGDSLDRAVPFVKYTQAAGEGAGVRTGNFDLTKFSGREIFLTFEMKDADLYSMQFTGESKELSKTV